MVSERLMDVDFNPHSRKGSDQMRGSEFWWQEYFNPHSRKGSDKNPENDHQELSAISIHTPARGVTRNVVKIYKTESISIHTPARGVT